MRSSSAFLLALGSAAALSHLPAAHVHRRARAAHVHRRARAAVMQFEEETTDRRAVRLAEPSAQPPPAAARPRSKPGSSKGLDKSKYR